jgi:site-specific recombinase XerD
LPILDHQLREQWEAARADQGLEHIRFHDLRHTYASWLVQAGAPLKAVQDLLGHTTLAMTQRYAHLGADHLRSAVDLISATGPKNDPRENVTDIKKGLRNS